MSPEPGDRQVHALSYASPPKRRWFARRKVAGVILGFVLLFFVGLRQFKQKSNYVCGLCGSSKTIVQWRSKVWRGVSVPLTPRLTRTRTSMAVRDELIPAHPHDWIFASESRISWFSRKFGCGLPDYANAAVKQYEYDTRFRDQLREAMANGVLSKAQITALFTMDRALLDAAVDPTTPADELSAGLKWFRAHRPRPPGRP